MKASTLERAALCLILGLGICADGLSDVPGGMSILMGGVALSGLLIHLAHTNRAQKRRAARNGPPVPLDTWRKRPSESKRKAATVVTTPQRQVKQSNYANISHPYFTGVKGDCQMEKQHVLTAEELASLLRDSLADLVPEKDIEMYASENYETGAVYFNLKIRYPFMDVLRPVSDHLRRSGRRFAV